MDSKVCCVFQLALLLSVALALALAGGSVEVGLASKAGGDGSYAARQMMVMAQAATTAAKSTRRRVLGGISTSSLNPDRPACLGSCPAAGRPYTGRGCQKAYRCAG